MPAGRFAGIGISCGSLFVLPRSRCICGHVAPGKLRPIGSGDPRREFCGQCTAPANPLGRTIRRTADKTIRAGSGLSTGILIMVPTFRKQCRFCRGQALEPMPRHPFEWLRRLFCLGLFYCPHCFDLFLRPVRPRLLSVAFLSLLYVGAYVSFSDPSSTATLHWPDRGAPVVRQTVFAPLIRYDPRIREARLDEAVLSRPVRTASGSPTADRLRHH